MTSLREFGQIVVNQLRIEWLRLFGIRYSLA